VTEFPKPDRKIRTREERLLRERQYIERGQMRHDCLVRGKYLCEVCGKSLASQGFEFHHVCYGSGKRLQMESLKTTAALCPKCHRSAHSGEMPTLERLAAWATKYGYEEALMEISRRMEKITLFGEDR